jgi:phage tail sheath protein FI
MAVQVSYPGVYIEEFQPAAPIQGVSTSVAAFLGQNTYGPPNTPTLITSWDEYQRRFAAPPPTPPEDDDFLWYAVRGFFANGGQTCFVTAVSNATPDFLELTDEPPVAGAAVKKTVKLTARRTGQISPPIRVTSAVAHTVTTANAYAPTANVAGNVAASTVRSLDVGDPAKAAQFLAGDAVLIEDATPKSEKAIVARTAGTVIFFTDILTGPFANPTIKLEPLASFATTLRVGGPAGANGPAGLVPGSIVTFSQDPGGGGAVKKQTTVVTNVRAERISPTLTTYRVTLKDGLSGFTLYGTNPINLQSEEFKLTVMHDGTNVPYDGLSMSATHPRYYASVINNDPTGLITAQPIEPANTTALPFNRPILAAAAPLAGAQTHNASLIAGRSTDYDSALAKLESIKDISIVAVPDRTDTAVQGAVLDHCFRLYDRFAIFDSVKGTEVADIENQANALENNKGFGALYYPWLEVVSAKTGARLLVPPSGYIAGIYARTDINRGVFKAPAGNESIVSGAIGVERRLSDTEQGFVNLKGVNVIRVFQRGGRPIVWGARTTSKDTNWQYVNIRRLFLFLEESIQVGIRSAVFEPNNTALWQKLKRTITAFLTQQWRDGALFGEKVEEAFYVRIDAALNPDNERALGRLYIEIGVRPSYPAEFIIVRIGIWQGGSEVSEG